MTKYLIFFPFLISINLTARSAATFNIELAVENGKLLVTNAELETELTYPPDATAQLKQLLNEGFTILDSLIKNDSMQWCAEDGICYGFEEFREDYILFTQNDGAGEDVTFAYLDIVDEGEAELPLLELFSENIFYIIQQVHLVGAPIDLIAKEFEEEDYEVMTFYFDVKPPVNVSNTNLIWLDNDTVKTNAKNRALKGLDGQLFFDQQIIQRLDDYFVGLNFPPSYFLKADEFRVLPPKISRFQVITKKEKEVNKIAYLLLPHKLYKAFLKLPKDSIRFTSLSGSTIYQFDLLKQVNEDIQQLPILLSNNLRQTQAQLFQQGYNLNTNPTPNGPLDGLVAVEEQSLYLDLKAIQLETDTNSTNIEPATPNVVTDDEFVDEVIDNDFNQRENLEQKRQLTRFKRNFIGIGADYYLNDETRLKAVYQRLLKNGSNLSLELGYALNEAGFKEGGFVLSGNFSKDYLFFNALKKRLLLQLSAGTDYTANRIFANESFKERRTGAKIRSEIDWYRNQTNRLFQSYFKVSDEKIILKNFDNLEAVNTNLFSTEWGNVFYLISPIKLHTTRFKLENSLRFGWAGINETNPATFFSTGAIKANLNQKIVKGMAFDFTLYHQWASGKTPTFEQIGHQVATNRGFREDVVIGRKLWGGTAEFWSPFPRFGNKSSKTNQYFYQHLRLAIFNDFSSYNQLLEIEDAITFWSPGIGIRLLMGPAQVNFDWALRRSNTEVFNGKGQFSMNLILNTPFQ